MAQWSLPDRTLFAKVVYYGPALGGKTTNLRMLHRLTDPDGRNKLVSLATADDRTLFFDLLPMALGNVLGYRVAIKLYTVPGQVRYDTTRRVVLAGADAVVFVADSDPARERDNRLSWDDLRRNMRANRLDPAAVPVVIQLNKRDLPSATRREEMERVLGAPPRSTVEAVACDGAGVVATFIAACRAMLQRLVAMAEPATRRSLDEGDLVGQIDAAFAPYLAREASAGPDAVPRPTTAIVARAPDLLESAVDAGATLGAELADEHARATRLSREAEVFRQLSDCLRATGASFDRDAVVDAALSSALAVLGASGAALVERDERGRAAIVRCLGAPLAPLFAHEVSAAMLARMLSRTGPAAVQDLPTEIPGLPRDLRAWRALVTVPVEPRSGAALVAAFPAPDGEATDDDLRFVATLAGHLAVGLEKVAIYEELRAHRDRLEETVRERTRSLARAYDELKSLDAMKDRLLCGVSHEMRTPLTAIVGAATFLKDYDGDRGQREEMAAGILFASAALDGLIGELLRVARLEGGTDLAVTDAPCAEVVAEALRLARAEERASVLLDPGAVSIRGDAARLARALASLLDNAVKFGPVDAPVEVRVVPCVLGGPAAGAGVAIAVLDRGPGLAEEDLERAFAPFEQGGDPLTGKPAGLGLGLYEARAIARRHGGTLTYRPRPDGGSEFRLSLPSADAPSREARRA